MSCLVHSARHNRPSSPLTDEQISAPNMPQDYIIQRSALKALHCGETLSLVLVTALCYREPLSLLTVIAPALK